MTVSSMAAAAVVGIPDSTAGSRGRYGGAAGGAAPAGRGGGGLPCLYFMPVTFDLPTCAVSDRVWRGRQALPRSVV